MSSSTPRYHIPFPRAFLSLNTPINKSTTSSAVASPEFETSPHSFLSNRADVPRSYSISSVSSNGSASSPPSSPANKPADCSGIEAKVPAFLALNSKFTPPPATAKKMSSEKGGFLSNY